MSVHLNAHGEHPPKTGALVIGTLNVRALAGRMPEVVSLASEHSIDILCLQETRLSEDSLLAAQHAAKQAGWSFLSGTCAIDLQGAPTAGVAVLSRWHVERKIFPAIDAGLLAQRGRWQVLRVHRPGQRPFLLTNLYLHASSKRDASNLGHQLFELVAATGEDCLFVGDWNNTPEEEPAVAALRSGQLHLADDVAGPFQLHQPTRANGRHIDYALHTVNVVPSARNQVTGVADHDLVYYSFPVRPAEACLRVAPPRKLNATEKVDQQTWESTFPFNVFQQEVQQGNVQAAWVLLSDHAEICLQAQQGRKRSTVPEPVQAATAPVKPESIQSVLERRLRRTHRRLQEVQKPGAPCSLVRKVRLELLRLAHHFPELSEFEVFDPNLVFSVQQCISKESAAASLRRLTKWRERMDEDEQALIRWVKGADSTLTSTSKDPAVPIHPQLKAEHFASQWEEIWSPAETVSSDAILPFLNWIPEGGFPCPDIALTGDVLFKHAKRAAGRAAGPDGWMADAWILLPQGFFDALAQLWTLVLSNGILPPSWAAVRCVLLPKEIGYRPISVAALAWRIGIGALIQQLTGWIDLWAHPALVGGLKGRGSTSAHDELHDSILNEQNIFGAKIDVEKCFDNVSFQQALLVWEKLGAPSSILRALKGFYSSQTKTMEWLGFSSSKQIKCSQGLLQGCPSSCALLAGLMTTWQMYVQARAPSLKSSVFIDDRTFWSSKQSDLRAAVDASAHIDAAMGFKLNASKCEFFYKCSRLQLQSFKSWNVCSGRQWCVTKQFKLLGIHYNATKARRVPIDSRVIAKVQARLRRLRTASRKHRHKRKLVKSLVLSLFTHTGPWTTIPKKLLAKWRTSIETTVLGFPQAGRSRFLIWSCFLGPDLDPEYVLDSKVILHELWKLRRDVMSCVSLTDLEALRMSPAPSIAKQRLTEVLDKWNWQQVSKTCFNTPAGTIDLFSDGETTVKAAMRAGWEHQLWNSEPRAAEVRGQETRPVTAVHKAWMKEGPTKDPAAFAVACGAGKDSRKLAKKFNLQHVQCVCGRDWPSACHLTWHCPQSDLPICTSLPTDQPAERLLLQCVRPPPEPPPHAPRSLQPLHSVVRAVERLAEEDVEPSSQMLFATDGSSQVSHGIRRAAWGFACKEHSFAHHLCGCDQNIFAAETFAVLQVLLAADSLSRIVCIICDSLAVVRTANAVRKGLSLPVWAPGVWRAISLLSQESEIHWVPAHNRHSEWLPPVGGSALEWRSLNCDVDAVVQAKAKLGMLALQEWNANCTAAVAWSSFALARQRKALLQLEERLQSQASVV